LLARSSQPLSRSASRRLPDHLAISIPLKSYFCPPAGGGQLRVYKTPEIRNVAVVGHGASGKTSLVDALAFVAGSSKRHGSVKDGTSLTDTSPEEIERGYSINLGCGIAEWRDTKINLVDTPGYLDFQGDAVAGL